MFRDERDGTIRHFDEIGDDEGFVDANADFTELAELNDTPEGPDTSPR
ncbi:hypothetical protein [Corynebacterium yudongzhengii]|nr:hypothetical protein [Corynebacterium yudongzhengii]